MRLKINNTKYTHFDIFKEKNLCIYQKNGKKV